MHAIYKLEWLSLLSIVSQGLYNQLVEQATVDLYTQYKPQAIILLP